MKAKTQPLKRYRPPAAEAPTASSLVTAPPIGVCARRSWPGECVEPARGRVPRPLRRAGCGGQTAHPPASHGTPRRRQDAPPSAPPAPDQARLPNSPSEDWRLPCASSLLLPASPYFNIRLRIRPSSNLPRLILDLTVPSGTPRIWAISA